MSSEHITTKVMIFTYWWRLSVTQNLKRRQHTWNVRTVNCVVSSQTKKYSNTRHSEKPAWASLSSRSLGQCQITKRTSSTGIQWLYGAAMLEICVCQKKCVHIMVPKFGMSKCSIYRILKTHQRHYFRAKCVGTKWVVRPLTVNGQ